MKNGIKSILLLITILALSQTLRTSPGVTSVQAAGGGIIYLPSVTKGCQNQIAYQPSADANIEAETLRQINAQRAAHGGLAPVAMNKSLVQSARFHSIDMSINHLTTHNGSSGEDPWTRFGWMCDQFGMKGEIIGWGSGVDVAGIVNAWMNSAGHRAIILTSGYTQAGVGYAVSSGSQPVRYWTVDFGAAP